MNTKKNTQIVCPPRKSIENMPPLKKLKTSETSSKDAKMLSTQKTSGVDWRCGCDSIPEMHRLASNQSILTDVTFLVGEKSQVFHAHRLFLALASPVFEAMFYGVLAEKSDTPITIPDVDPEGFSHLIDHVYSKVFRFNDYIDAFKTAFAADKYCLNSLKKECEQFLCFNQLDETNVWIFLQNAIYLNSSDIKRKCIYHLKVDTKSALKHSSFLETNARTVEAFLHLAEEVQVDENQLLESVLEWVEHNSSSEAPFKDVAKPLLRNIRFSAISPEEFVVLLETKRLNEVLTMEDALAILKHLHVPNMCPLPVWCSRKPKRSFKDVKIPEASKAEYKNLYNSLAECFSVPTVEDESDSESSSSSSSSSPSSSSSSTSSSSPSSPPSAPSIPLFFKDEVRR